MKIVDNPSRSTFALKPVGPQLASIDRHAHEQAVVDTCFAPAG
jgi:hypothetical protein